MNKSYKGSAIIVAVLAIAAVTTVVFGVALLIPKDLRQSQNLEASLGAENAAWAGIEHGLALLREAKEKNSFFELSTEGNPYGSYTVPAGGTNCLDSSQKGSSQCTGLDRLLGTPRNQTPVWFPDVLGTPNTQYGLVVWHRRQNVGTTDLLDGSIKTRSTANINPILNRDESRRLDVTNTTSLTLTWMPIIDSAACQNGPGFRASMVVSLYDNQGNTLQRTERVWSSGADTYTLSSLTNVHTMGVRFFVTSSNEAALKDCFARYSLQNTNNETADLGFDVIDSIGVHGNVRRKIRVLVNRSNGQLLNIFDFGVVCKTCVNI